MALQRGASSTTKAGADGVRRTTWVVPSERCTRARTSTTVADRPLTAMARPVSPPAQRIAERSVAAPPVANRRGAPATSQLSGQAGAMASCRSPRAGTFQSTSQVSGPVCCSSR